MPTFQFIDTNKAYFLDINKTGLFFRSKQCAGAPGANFPNGYISVATSSLSTGDFTYQFSDTALAYFNPGTSDPTNKSTLDLLTARFGTDYLNWNKLSLDMVFAGICAFLPNGIIQTYEFTYGNSNQQCTTRIYSYQFNFGFQELGHYDYANDCLNSTDTGLPNFDGAPWIEFYGPPGICTSISTSTSTATATGSGGNLILTRWGFMEQDGRPVKKFFSFDIV